jgi:hypothetical protein
MDKPQIEIDRLMWKEDLQAKVFQSEKKVSWKQKTNLRAQILGAGLPFHSSVSTANVKRAAGRDKAGEVGRTKLWCAWEAEGRRMRALETEGQTDCSTYFASGDRCKAKGEFIGCVIGKSRESTMPAGYSLFLHPPHPLCCAGFILLQTLSTCWLLEFQIYH